MINYRKKCNIFKPLHEKTIGKKRCQAKLTSVETALDGVTC